MVNVNRAVEQRKMNVKKWSSLVLSVSILSLGGCKKDTPTQPVPEKETLATPSALPTTSGSVNVAIPLPETNTPKEIPTFVPASVTFKEGKPEGVFLMDDGNIAVIEGLRVGRIVDERIEWLEKKVPETNTHLGGTHISWVGGRWPDAVDVIYKSNNGRASQPTFYPLTGKGNTIVYGEGGGMGDILGVARLGESTFIAGMELFGPKFATVRGPAVIRGRKPFAEAGCKEDEIPFQPNTTEISAVTLRWVGATPAGTVISLGVLCYGRNGALEVWEKDTKTSKIIDLGAKVKDVDYYSGQILPGKGDEAWIRANGSTVLHYVEGGVETLPEVQGGSAIIFMSPNGKLYAGNPWGIHRWETDHWTQIARFAWAEDYPRFFADAKEQFWRNAGAAQKLREGKSIEMRDDCENPFVHIYDVSPDNKPDFTFPSTRKALASFPEVSDLTLVDFNEGKRRLGVAAKSKAQAEAVLAHIKTNMPKEKPRLVCYAPVNPRKIELQSKGK